MRTVSRMIGVESSYIRSMGEHRGFNDRHLPRLELAAHLIGKLPRQTPANEWLRTPHPRLAGRSPVDLVFAYGADAPIPDEVAASESTLVRMQSPRWWTTMLALVEVPAATDSGVLRHLRTTPAQRGRDGDEYLTYDVRWMWPDERYPSRFTIAEIGSLHRPRRADQRWTAVINNGLAHNEAWFGMGRAEPLREALLTHWHAEMEGPQVGVSFNDSPVPVDVYNEWMYRRRIADRPDAPPWCTDETSNLMRYLAQLVAGGPRVREDYRPFPGVRDGRKAELWTMHEPFEPDSLQTYVGRLYRQRVDFLDHQWINTGVRLPDDAVVPEDPRSLRLLGDPNRNP